jgi:hypothetical protein
MSFRDNDVVAPGSLGAVRASAAKTAQRALDDTSTVVPMAGSNSRWDLIFKDPLHRGWGSH